MKGAARVDVALLIAVVLTLIWIAVIAWTWIHDPIVEVNPAQGAQAAEAVNP